VSVTMESPGFEAATIRDAVDQLWALRSALESSRDPVARVALASVQMLDIVVLDGLVASRAELDFADVRYQDAHAYVSRGNKGRDNLLLEELKIIRHLSEGRVRQIHRRAKEELRRRSPDGIVSVARPGDLQRHWAFVLNYIDDTLNGRGARSRQWRKERALNWMDGLIVLLSNVPKSVQGRTFHLSASLAAGTLP
jgi:hypothetical protein